MRFAGFSLRTFGSRCAGLPGSVAPAMSFQRAIAQSTSATPTPAFFATAGRLACGFGAST